MSSSIRMMNYSQYFWENNPVMFQSPPTRSFHFAVASGKLSHHYGQKMTKNTCSIANCILTYLDDVSKKPTGNCQLHLVFWGIPPNETPTGSAMEFPQGPRRILISQGSQPLVQSEGPSFPARSEAKQTMRIQAQKKTHRSMGMNQCHVHLRTQTHATLW